MGTPKLMKLYEYCWNNYKSCEKFSFVRNKVKNYRNKLQESFAFDKKL